MELVLGRRMRDRGVRNQMFVATKVGFNRSEVGRGLSRRIILNEAEGRLKRLGTDHIDLYYVHTDNRDNPLEETLPVFDELHRQGKVRHIGCSNYRSRRIEQVRWLSHQNGWISYRCVQQRHTCLRPTPGAGFDPQLAVDDELLDYCGARQEDFLLLGYSSTLGGAYAGRTDRPVPHQYHGADTDARMAMLKRVASDTGAQSVQIVYAWMLRSTPVALPLVSAGSLQQLDLNIDSEKIALSDEQMTALDNAGNPKVE